MIPADGIKVTLTLSAHDIGSISIALDEYVANPGATYGYEFKSVQERFDRLYRSMWELERQGVKEMRVP